MIADVLEALARYAQNNLTENIKQTEDKTLAISCVSLFRKWQPGTYKTGDIRTDGTTPYECLLDHDSITNPDWTIDVRTIWKPYHSRQKEYALPFIHPTGAHDLYKAGEYMTLGGKIYLANQDTNYSPEEYGEAWNLVE